MKYSTQDQVAVARLKARLSMLNEKNLETVGTKSWAKTLQTLTGSAVEVKNVHKDYELLNLSLESVDEISKIRQHLDPDTLTILVNTLRVLAPIIEFALSKFAISPGAREFLREYSIVSAAKLVEEEESRGSSDDEDESQSDEDASESNHKSTDKIPRVSLGENIDKVAVERDSDIIEETTATVKGGADKQESRPNAGPASSAKGKRPSDTGTTFRGQKRCERCRTKNIETCTVHRDVHGKYKACNKCYRLKIKCSYANDGKGRASKRGKAGNTLRSVPSGSRERGHHRSQAQLEVVAPQAVVASVRHTRSKGAVNDSGVSSPLHESHRSDDISPSEIDVSPSSPKQGPGARRGRKRKLSNTAIQPPTLRPRHTAAADTSISLHVSATRPSSSTLTGHPADKQIPSSSAAPSQDTTQKTTDIHRTSQRQKLLSRVAVEDYQISLAQLDIHVANLKLKAAQTARKYVTEELKKLGKEPEQVPLS